MNSISTMPAIRPPEMRRPAKIFQRVSMRGDLICVLIPARSIDGSWLRCRSRRVATADQFIEELTFGRGCFVRERHIPKLH
ncbi:hypothetical protein [Bradyrhizobium genosp. SA-3]|uniref:hypothetical protein n=1 Tax=Bradyrhizobium genosp. SA-3 TaxID=508868 RepID=UPI0010295E6C|nr:hypothetical protein [Bradyrhizobium genosp. SA-3]